MAPGAGRYITVHHYSLRHGDVETLIDDLSAAVQHLIDGASGISRAVVLRERNGQGLAILAEWTARADATTAATLFHRDERLRRVLLQHSDHGDSALYSVVAELRPT